MNLDKYTTEALAHPPRYAPELAKGLHRHEIIRFLTGTQNIGIELGVADGLMSERLIISGKFKALFGVDAYADIHDAEEYKCALKTIGIERNYKLLRCRFDQALDLFPDHYFDFIYIDGFAHTGEDGGETLVDWYNKLKVGGVMSGDDYHTDWPLVIWAVNHFSNILDVRLTITDGVLSDKYSQYPSWFFKRNSTEALSHASLDPRLMEVAKKERRRIHRLRTSRLARLNSKLVRTFGKML